MRSAGLQISLRQASGFARIFLVSGKGMLKHTLRGFNLEQFVPNLACSTSSSIEPMLGMAVER